MYQIRLEPGGRQFSAKNGETVLGAALREGIDILYGCKNGICGMCKGRVLSGTVENRSTANDALSADEKKLGLVLLCQSTPQTDLAIEAEQPAPAPYPVETSSCRILNMEKVSDDVMILSLWLGNNRKLEFLAGHYLDFLLEGGARRSFSIANAPSNSEVFQIHVRHVVGGRFTDCVFNDLREGDELRFEGPFGNFHLREASQKPIVLVASGTGFAPIKALIECLIENGITRPTALYWGGRRPKDLYMHLLAQRWAEEIENFKYVPVISDELPEDDWRGRKGLVHRAVMSDFPDLSGYQVYACGIPAMVDAARESFFRDCGLLESEFFADYFSLQSGFTKPEI